MAHMSDNDIIWIKDILRSINEKIDTLCNRTTSNETKIALINQRCSDIQEAKIIDDQKAEQQGKKHVDWIQITIAILALAANFGAWSK
jgi:hypothetical protein